jgi:Ca2+-binding RTX toxin-like protein
MATSSASVLSSWRGFAASRGRATVAWGAALVLMTGVTAQGPRAEALPPDDGVSQLLGALGEGGDPTRNLAKWTEGLGSVGKLGEQLPLVSASPGGLLGFNDLFAKAVTDELAGATTFGDLAVDKAITIDGGRTGHLITTVANEGDGKKLSLVVRVDRQVSGQDLHLSSATPKVDLTVSDGITVDLESRLALDLVWTGPGDNKVYLASGTVTPRLDVDAYASIDNTAATAALGILGVSLTGSSLDVKAHFVGRISDPDNDGKLFFTENAPGDGELSQDGSLDGLVSVGLDPEGSQPIDGDDEGSRGSLHATFELGAAAAAVGLDLPSDINATVTVDWDDIGTGAPTVEAPGLADTVGKFQNLSLNDLASGLAQVVIGITAIQKAKFDPDGGGPLPETGDLDLPFMRGRLSDAIQAGAKLKEFLADNTVPAPGQPEFVDGVTDPAQAGQPTFTSLQDLLKNLSEHSGISLSNLDWDTGTSKLAVTIGMTQAAPGSAVELDEVSAAASGIGDSYGAKTLTVDDAGWEPNQWLGRRITAGASAGTVASNTADTITLTTDWIGGQPASDTPFVISGAEPHTGAVTFANLIDNGSGQGIVNANADQTFAEVTPSFATTVTLVLDLQDPRTGDQCDGFEGNTEACPFTKTDGPFNTEVESLPLNTDRVMLRTGSRLFGADFPIDSGVDLTANAGFFKVRLQGSLKVCHSSLGANCAAGTQPTPMLSVGLEEIGDTQHDVRMSALFAALVADPASLLDVDVNVRAYADVDISLPDAEDFLPSGATTGFTAAWADLTDPSTLSLDTSDLSEIFKLDFDANDPAALFTLLIKSLQTLSAQLASADTADGSNVFNKEIPGLGRSLRDLLASDEANAGTGVSYGAASLTDGSRSGDSLFPTNLVGRTVVVGTQVAVVETVSDDRKTLTMTKDWESEPDDGTAYSMRSALADATDHLLATPPDNIQDAVKLLNQTLGTEAVQFRYLETAGVGNLVLDVDWQRSYRVASPIKLSLGNIGGTARTFAGVETTGLAQVDVDAGVDVGLVIPLVAGAGPSDGTTLKVLEDSSLSVGIKSELNGIVKGVVGPLSIALGNPGGDQRAVAKADLSLSLGKTGAAEDTPVSFTSFLGAVSVNFNDDSGTVDCGEGLETDLMVCANLPLFLNNSGASNGWSSIGDIFLRLPKSTSPADLFSISGNLPAPDDTKTKLELPPDLGQELLDAILDFGNLGDGLEAYLARIEQAFQVASFQGKLPLLGEDLQQGADFIGDLRTELRESIWNELPGAGRPANATEFKEFIEDNLADALAEVDIDAANLSVDFACTATLHKVATPTVSATKNPVPTTDPPTPPPPSGTWQYKIVAFQGSGSGTGGDTIASAAGSANNWTNLDFGSSNTVNWSAVDYASGYKILRKRPGDSGFKQIATRTGTTFTDTSAADTGTAYDDAAITTEPKLDPCPLDFIDGVFLEFDAQRGTVSADQGCQDTGAPEPCISDSLPLDIGIPGLALRQGMEGDADGISYKLGFALHFRLGLNKQDGFFIATHDGWGPDNKALPELMVGVNFDLPATMKAELAFITINVDKAQGAGHNPALPLFAGAFQIDLKATAGEASCFTGSGAACTPNDTAKLRFADLGSRSVSDVFAVSLTGKIHLDWIIEAEVDSALPGIRANFQLDWSFDNKAPQAFGAPTIAFKDVGISAGSFFEGLLGDVVKEMKRVTGPLQPVMDTLYAPIPVLSDLSRLAGGDDVTLVTLAKTFNTLTDGPSLDFVDTVKAVIEFINRLPDCDESTPASKQACFVPLGAFTVDGAKALVTSNAPSNADKMYASLNPLDGSAVKADLNTKDSDTTDGNKVFGTGGGEGDTEKSGFAFPILDEPAKAFNLLMGGDVDLVTFDSGPLTLGFSWRQEFGPVYAPPPVFVTMAGSASVTLRIKAGLDTYGLRKTVEAMQAGDSVEPITALDGLYFATVDTAGNPLPVVTLTGEIAAGAAVSAIIIKVGIEGGLRLTISFLWRDPNDDGKFRVSEFLQTALNNPMCLFTMNGRLSLFLRVYITIGIGIFSTTFSFTLADVTLLDFTVEADCEPPPPKLGGTSGDTLVVYAGKFGGTTFRGHSAWSNTGPDYEQDTVKVTALHYAQTPEDPTGVNGDFDGFAIDMLGEHREYLDPGLERVVVDGTGYAKPMVVTFLGDGKKTTDEAAGDEPTVFDKEAVVIGSDADDKISTGTGASYVDGRDGNDIIVTHDTGQGGSRAWVAGGPHADTITTGDGDDKVAGDASLGSDTTTFSVTHNDTDGGGTQSVTVFDWTKAKDPTTQVGGPNQGDDTIGVGLGANKVRGNGGDDKIGVASDAPDGSRKAKSNTLIGDLGSDSITGGSAADKIFTAAEDEFGFDESGPPDPGATNVVDTGEGSDNVWGSTGVDLVTSHSRPDQKATLRGGSGNDVLIGGYGTDEVYGGPGDDYVIAEPSDVSGPGADEIINGRNYGPTRSLTKLPLPAGVSPNSKTLVGGLGNDHVIGGDGPSTIFGDKRIDAEKCKPGDPVVSDPVAESTSAATGDGNDLVLGGAGVDTVSAGGGDDIVKTFADLDLVCGQEGSDTIYGGDDADHIWGGSGPDVLFGENGEDHVFGNAGNDTAYGGAGADVMEGNNGADWISGGLGDDIIYGGTRAAGRADTDTSGAGGTAKGDDLYGDAGADILIGDNGTVNDPYPFDLDGATPNAGAGDRIHGGAQNDKAYGGLGDDIVNGNDGDDYLEGNKGSDTVHGNAGEDRIIGGSSQQVSPGAGRPDTGDFLYGDAGADLIAGDNASLTVVADPADATRVTHGRDFAGMYRVELLDLGLTPTAGTSGGDVIEGGAGDDVAYGQGGNDRIKGNDDDDYLEGGPGVDWVEGNHGDDDLVGGSSTPLSGTGDATSGQPDTDDALFGGPGDDVILGDNGQLLRLLEGDSPTRATVRLGSTPGESMTRRIVQKYDLRVAGSLLTPPPSNRYGADRISAGEGVDVIYGQDGDDFVSGGAHDDYVEGNGGADVIRGDLALDEPSAHTTVVPLADPGWPGTPSGAAQLTGATTPDGQDDLIGGSSTRGFRDGGDFIEGNGADDVLLGDNGTLLRTLQGAPGSLTEKVYADRYPNAGPPANATRSRTADQDAGDVSTRFCTEAQATCEVAGAFGDDTMFGDDGNDGMWGQDGNDVMYGGAGDDDMFGELGDDTMFGGAGEDVMLGDRGGVVNQFLDEGDEPAEFSVTLKQVPQESFTGFRRGLYDRRVDLLHDVDGDQWIGASTDPAMPHDGITTGGRDKIRGGPDADNIHGGYGDDLANGDSGGDRVFGDDGEDVLWGGKGCDPVLDAANPECLTAAGVFDPAARGANDRFVDHVFGGVGESDPAEQDVAGSDILDFNPRGSYPGGCATGRWPTTTGSGKNAVTVDPCEWFEMTDKDDADPTNNQHHHGTDWLYGGWDRDVMQGNVTANGPNPGDRLIDWTGAYNLYTHCNASYGGYNDIRLLAPDLFDFLTGLAWADGAGRSPSDVLTPGTSAYRELAFTYTEDFKEHGNGKAYPTTPGHFEQIACEE